MSEDLQMDEALFIPEDGGFVPTRSGSSPWGEAFVHGGPPAGLLARSVELFAGSPEMQVSRLTFDLFRPVPMAPLQVAAHTVREGRRIHVVDAVLSADGVEVAGVRAVLLRTADIAVPPSAGSERPAGPQGLELSRLGAGRRANGENREGFHTVVEARWSTRLREGGLPAAWIRLPLELVAGEVLSPLARLAAICDFVNAIANGGEPTPARFINVDCSINLTRLPVGEWICLQSERAVEPTGVGVASARIWDEEGLIGRATQALLSNAIHA
jgi:hypothetical protein